MTWIGKKFQKRLIKTTKKEKFFTFLAETATALSKLIENEHPQGGLEPFGEARHWGKAGGCGVGDEAQATCFLLQA